MNKETINGIIVKIDNNIQLFKLSENYIVQGHPYSLTDKAYDWLKDFTEDQILFINYNLKETTEKKLSLGIQNIFSINALDDNDENKITVLELLKDYSLQEVVSGAIKEYLG